MNYQELFETIAETTENRGVSFLENIPEFVRRAERQIYNSVQLKELRRNVTSKLMPNHPYMKLPSDFLAVYSLAVVGEDGRYNYLINKDVNFIREAYPHPDDAGMPRHYGLFEDCTAILGPVPDKDYKVELHQFYYPQSIVEAGESWVGNNFEQVLVYGALVHANVFMKGNPEMTAEYDKQFKENLGLLKRLADGMERQDAYRSGQVKIPVT